MTQTINGHKVTDRDDARMRVRAPESAVPVADSPPSAGESACTPVHTRAIPDQQPEINDQDGPKVRDVVSQHGRDAVRALDQSWLLTEVPLTAGEAWRTVPPAKGEASGKAAWLAMTTAGLFRALVVTGGHLVLLAVGTRIRAGVALVLTVLACASACAAHHL